MSEDRVNFEAALEHFGVMHNELPQLILIAKKRITYKYKYKGHINELDIIVYLNKMEEISYRFLWQ